MLKRRKKKTQETWLKLVWSKWLIYIIPKIFDKYNQYQGSDWRRILYHLKLNPEAGENLNCAQSIRTVI